jgi:hypothetical protein
MYWRRSLSIRIRWSRKFSVRPPFLTRSPTPTTGYSRTRRLPEAL